MKQTTIDGELSKHGALFRVLALLLFYNIVFGVGILWFFQRLGFSGIAPALISSQLSIFILFLAYFDFEKSQVEEALKFNINKKQASLAFLSAGVFLIINIILGLIIPSTEISEYTQNTTQKVLDTNNLIIMIIFPVIIAPIVEELAFRAGFKRILVDKGGWSSTFYVIFSGVTFGLMHVQPGIPSIGAVAITGSIGALNAILYLKTNNIFIPILSHMLYNLSVIAFALSGV